MNLIVIISGLILGIGHIGIHWMHSKEILKKEYGCERITIQSGGTVNSLFLRQKLFDYIDIVLAPLLVGGKDTSTLIDGESIEKVSDLCRLSALKLIECKQLENSYIRLGYQVLQ